MTKINTKEIRIKYGEVLVQQDEHGKITTSWPDILELCDAYDELQETSNLKLLVIEDAVKCGPRQEVFHEYQSRALTEVVSIIKKFGEAQKEIAILKESLEDHEHEAEMKRKRDECIGRNL